MSKVRLTIGEFVFLQDLPAEFFYNTMRKAFRIKIGGWFFIITLNKHTGAPVFSLGNYKTALKSGMFVVNS